MNQLVRIFALLLAIAGSSPFVFGQSAPRSLLLMTGGGLPGSARFQVELSESGLLRVTKESMPISEKGELTKVTATKTLTDQDQDLLFALASNADDFSSKTSGAWADGTNAALLIKVGSQSTKRECTNAPKWPVGSKTKAFLSELNKHLPLEMRVF